MSDYLKITVLPAGNTVEVPEGTPVIDLIGEKSPEGSLPVVAAKICNHYASLMDRITVECTVEPVSLGSTAGMRIYRNSLIYLFELVSRSVFPNRRVVIGHSLGHGFYLGFRDGGPPAVAEEAKLINLKMKDLVERNLPIVPGEISWKNAVETFRDRSFPSTAQLMEELNEPRVGIWRCNDFISLRHSPLVPLTGMLRTFSVECYREGFLLRFPPSRTPEHLGGRDEEPKLFTVYEEHKKWGEILGVSDVAQLNILSRDRAQARDFIQTAEALHDRKIAEYAGLITADRDRVKAVMIAGPSSSGKTTFTKKLALSLKSTGLKPQLVSLDDYYKEREDIPLDADGKPDFEVLEALDVDLFNRNLEDLLAGKEAEIPIFDFKKVGGRLQEGRKITLDNDSVLLFEGIHGLNPNLTPGMEKDKAFRIYISALTQLNLDDHDRIPTTDNRLIRRIVRDHQFRRYPAIDTLRIWPSVRRGEEKHIFPYQGSADVMFNSALDYELAVLKIFAEPLLRTVSPLEEEYGEARRLMSFLRNFTPFPVEEVPELSIIREFIGRSGFRY
jgi:uridine kinase